MARGRPWTVREREREEASRGARRARPTVARASPPLTRARALSPILLPPPFHPKTKNPTADPHDHPGGHVAEEVLIGWKGETWQPHHKEEEEQPARHPAQQDDAAAEHRTATTTPTHPPKQDAASPHSRAGERGWVELLSWRPRAFLYHGFLSDAECDHIIALTEGRVKRSGVVDAKTGKTKLDDIRTSTGAALERGQDATIAEIERRVSEWTRLPADHAEAMQVLRYEKGQTYKAHWDWFDDPIHGRAEPQQPSGGGKGNNTHSKSSAAPDVGNRIATILFYLSTVENSGATTLPLAFPANATRARQAYPPDPHADPQCAGAEPGGMGLAVRPRKGDALLFWDMLPDGKTVDRRSLHASCPTFGQGQVKYTATLWVHSKPYGAGYSPLITVGRCEDKDPRCEVWAAETPTSRCDREAGEMIGLRGKCRRACRDCALCAADDVLCLRANGRSRRAELLAWDEERRRKEESGGGGARAGRR